MKIIADENVFEPIIDFLKSEGYEVVSDCVCGLSGISDDRIYKIVVEQQMGYCYYGQRFLS